MTKISSILSVPSDSSDEEKQTQVIDLTRPRRFGPYQPLQPLLSQTRFPSIINLTSSQSESESTPERRGPVVTPASPPALNINQTQSQGKGKRPAHLGHAASPDPFVSTTTQGQEDTGPTYKGKGKKAINRLCESTSVLLPSLTQKSIALSASNPFTPPMHDFSGLSRQATSKRPRTSSQDITNYVRSPPLRQQTISSDPSSPPVCDLNRLSDKATGKRPRQSFQDSPALSQRTICSTSEKASSSCDPLTPPVRDLNRSSYKATGERPRQSFQDSPALSQQTIRSTSEKASSSYDPSTPPVRDFNRPSYKATGKRPRQSFQDSPALSQRTIRSTPEKASSSCDPSTPPVPDLNRSNYKATGERPRQSFQDSPALSQQTIRSTSEKASSSYDPLTPPVRDLNRSSYKATGERPRQSFQDSPALSQQTIRSTPEKASSSYDPLTPSVRDFNRPSYKATGERPRQSSQVLPPYSQQTIQSTANKAMSTKNQSIPPVYDLTQTEPTGNGKKRTADPRKRPPAKRHAGSSLACQRSVPRAVAPVSKFEKEDSSSSLSKRKVPSIRSNECFEKKLSPDEEKNAEQEPHTSRRSSVGFYLTKIKNPMGKNDPRNNNVPALALSDLITSDCKRCIFVNYYIDIPWMFRECPVLKNISILFAHGSVLTDADMACLYPHNNKARAVKINVHHRYGVHHSKCMFLFYESGVRVAILTSNFLERDWYNKTQGIWVQDFPLKKSNACIMSDFEQDLLRYFQHYPSPFDLFCKQLQKYDFDSANVMLVASVPGTHKDEQKNRYGHFRLHWLMGLFNIKTRKAVCQFSSIGSIDEPWLRSEFGMSMGLVRKYPPNPNDIALIWPTADQVRKSYEGWAAGKCLPCPKRNMKDFLLKHLHKWDPPEAIGRQQSMPHIKSYVGYQNNSTSSSDSNSSSSIQWVLLTSANFSKAAWGVANREQTQIYIRSYELGVLFSPLLDFRPSNFSVTPDHPILGKAQTFRKAGEKFVSTEDAKDGEICVFPLPYSLPPSGRYTRADHPWIWDETFLEHDMFGRTYPYK